jgi:CRISPR system Cascade subunit CasB
MPDQPVAEPSRQRSPSRYWARGSWGPSRALPPGEDLAALRRGLGREPGSVPGVWPFYTELTGRGEVSRQLRAEHIALSLFGLHQQSQQALMHRTGPSLGAAARALRQAGKFSPEAVDRRLVAAAQSSTVETLAVHLRGLVQQFSSASGSHALDYDRLMRDLVLWQTPDGVARVRRRWGGDYYAPYDRQNSTGSPTAPIGAQ